MSKRNGLILLSAFVALIVVIVFVAVREPGPGTPETRAEPESVLVGCITPLTGDGATYGAATRRGLDLAAEQINTNGGINGKPLRIVYEDSQLSGRVARNAIEKLIAADKVPVIIGAFSSSVTLAIAPFAEKEHVVLFSASSTADAIKDSGDYIFRNVPPNAAQGKTAAIFVREYLGEDSASVFLMNNDYGVSLSASFRENFEAGGGSITSVESYDPGATDFRAQLTKLKTKRPKVIFFPGHYEESGLILKQARELGIDAIFVGGDGSYSPRLVEIAGLAANGSYYTLMAMAYGSAQPEVDSFLSTFSEKYGQEPDIYAAYAYDALRIVADAIRRGGYTADGIKSALYGLVAFNGVTGLTTFDANGEVDKPYGIYKVANVQVEPDGTPRGGFELVDWRPGQHEK